MRQPRFWSLIFPPLCRSREREEEIPWGQRDEGTKLTWLHTIRDWCLNPDKLIAIENVEEFWQNCAILESIWGVTTLLSFCMGICVAPPQCSFRILSRKKKHGKIWRVVLQLVPVWGKNPFEPHPSNKILIPFRVFLEDFRRATAVIFIWESTGVDKAPTKQPDQPGRLLTRHYQ